MDYDGERYFICAYKGLGGKTEWYVRTDSWIWSFLVYRFSIARKDETILCDDHKTGKQWIRRICSTY